MPALTEVQRELVLPILADLRAKLLMASSGDPAVLHQMRRYIAKRLEFDSEETPLSAANFMNSNGNGSVASVQFANSCFLNVVQSLIDSLLLRVIQKRTHD